MQLMTAAVDLLSDPDMVKATFSVQGSTGTRQITVQREGPDAVRVDMDDYGPRYVTASGALTMFQALWQDTAAFSVEAK